MAGDEEVAPPDGHSSQHGGDLATQVAGDIDDHVPFGAYEHAESVGRGAIAEQAVCAGYQGRVTAVQHGDVMARGKKLLDDVSPDELATAKHQGLENGHRGS